MNVRRATPADAAEICAIYNDHVVATIVSFETEAVGTLEMAARVREGLLHHDWLVGLHEGRVVGYAYYGPFRARAAYRHTVEATIYLAEAVQGRGFGKDLYGALIASARAEGYRELVGVVALPNPASAALHRKLGFAEVGVLKNVGYKFGAYIDVGLWQLSLDEAR